MTYGTARRGRSGLGCSTGAPRTGTGRAARTRRPAANGSDWTFHLAPPTAGGRGRSRSTPPQDAGPYTSLAAMTSNLTPGVTQVSQTITVTP